MVLQKSNNTTPSGVTEASVSQEASTAATDLYSGMGGSTLVMIIGKSGRGKTSSLANLSPESTGIISVIGKPLPFMNARKYYSAGNFVVESNADSIRRKMKEFAKRPEITHLVLDDAQYVMSTEFMDKAMVKGYDKFTIMARNIWEILILSTKLKPSLKVFFLAHEEETERERKMKTLGKLLDDKITPEGLATIVLYADVAGDKDNRRYFFSTQSDGLTNAKSPFQMFPAQIPNDLQKVSARIDEYYNGVELKDSKIDFSI